MKKRQTVRAILRVCVLGVVAVVAGSFLYEAILLAMGSHRITQLLKDDGVFDPEELAPGNWAYWCRSGHPGIDSGASHFVLAANFARDHGLKYAGPSKYQYSDYRGWPLIFVAPDGAYQTVEIQGYGFDFEQFRTGRDCWMIGRSTVRLTVAKELFVVEK
jgi:hypothetical protein